MEPIIQLERATKDYGRGRGVFKVSFAVARGEVVGFLGANGAGSPSPCACSWGSYGPRRAGAHRRARLLCRSGPHTALGGYLPGELACPSDLTGRAFLDFVAAMRGARDHRRRDELTEFFELDPLPAFALCRRGRSKARHRGGFHGSARCAAAR
ncbi:MAG: hypothetical protein ACLSDQ_04365 [Adlercreutzia equolifaciens]